jgi:hypothetical protein
LAEAIKDAVRKSPLEIKQELTAAATLAGNLSGRPVSINTFGDHFHLSQQAREALVREAKTPRAAAEQFEFDLREFRNRIAYKSLELDNGAVLTAESSIFDDVFHKRVVDVADQLMEFSTRGRIRNEKLKVAQ